MSAFVLDLTQAHSHDLSGGDDLSDCSIWFKVLIDSESRSIRDSHQKRPETEGEHVKRNNLCVEDEIVYTIGMQALPFYCNAMTTCIHNSCNICQTKCHYISVDFYYLHYFSDIERKNHENNK